MYARGSTGLAVRLLAIIRQHGSRGASRACRSDGLAAPLPHPTECLLGLPFGGVIVAFVSASALVWPLAVAALGAAGVWHWRGLQRRTTLLLVPRVETYGDEEQGRRVQDQVLNTLRRSLTTEEMSLVGPVATVVGPNDTAFALLPSACLRRGLGAPAVASRPLGRNPSAAREPSLRTGAQSRSWGSDPINL